MHAASIQEQADDHMRSGRSDFICASDRISSVYAGTKSHAGPSIALVNAY